MYSLEYRRRFLSDFILDLARLSSVLDSAQMRALPSTHLKVSIVSSGANPQLVCDCMRRGTRSFGRSVGRRG